MEVENKDTVKVKLEQLRAEYEKEEQKLLDGLNKADREAVGHPVKDVYLLDSFTANGNKYLVRTSLTIARFEQFEALQVRVGYGVTFRQMFDNLRKAFDFLNASQVADASIVIYNLMNGIKNNLDGRENEILELCALFICREGEDVTQYVPELTKLKIDDWKLEGISMESFFSLAFNLVNGFTPVYQEVLQNISKDLESVRNETSKNAKAPESTLTGKRRK